MARIAGNALFLLQLPLCFQLLVTSTVTTAAPHRIMLALHLSPQPVDCSTVLYGMMDCLDYVTYGSNTSKPDESCCDGIKTVVQLSPSCICEAFQQAVSMKIDIDMSRAIALPALCKVAVPGTGTCTVVTPPAGTPVPSKSNEVPSPSLSPSLPVPSSNPMVPSSIVNPSAAAPLPSISSASLPSGVDVVVLAVCLAATALWY